MNPDAIHDPLLECLGIIAGRDGKSFSPRAAVAGLPLEKNRLTPSLFIRAAKQIHFEAHLVKRSIEEFHQLVLPAVMILNNNRACVLENIDANQASIVRPGAAIGEKIQLADLEKEYAGYAIYLKPEIEYDERAAEIIQKEKPSWFWSTLFSFRKIYQHVMVATFITNLFVLVAPLFIMNVYNRVIPNHATLTLWVLTIGAVVFFIFDLIARLMRTYLVDVAGQKADILLSAKLFKHLLSLKLANKPNSSGSVANYFSEFESLRDFFTSATFIGLIDLPFIILFLFVVWLIGGSIVIIPLVSIPIIAMIAISLERPARSFTLKAVQGGAQKQATLFESIFNLESIKALSAEGLFQKKWESSVASASQSARYARTFAGITLNLTIWIQQLVVVGVVVYGVYLILAGSLTIGGLIAVTILSGRALVLGPIASLLTRWERSRTALRGLDKLMRLPEERSEEKKFLHRAELRGDIEVKNLEFYYPKQTLPALKDINFSIKAGEHVGIVGRIGSGKSTLLKLIDNLYQPHLGMIRIDGTDCQEIDPADLRHHIQYVSSENFLFFGSVRENIVIGKPNASDEEMLKVAKITGVDEFVNAHPKGYDMQVGERGELLSTGQRQAIALARALLCNPSILLLDQPTSQVDNHFEQTLIHSLSEYLQGKTLLLVTHRVSVLTLVDRILILDNGNLVADGPKDAILEALTKSKVATPPEAKEQ